MLMSAYMGPALLTKEARKTAVPAKSARAELERTELYSEELGIDLSSRKDNAYFLWFIASILFGARISETVAKNTYRAFVRHGLTRPQTIIQAGWDFLVNPVMREGGYVRYDGRKSTQVLRDCDMLLTNYHGSLRQLHERAADSRDLERKLLAFYGVGPVTANIFLRELRPYWAKADPEPLPEIGKLAEKLGIALRRYDRKSLLFCRLEAGLIRQRRRIARP